MSITRIVEIPADRRIVIDVPNEIPSGSVILTIAPVPAESHGLEKTEVLDNIKLISRDEKQATPISDSLLGIFSHLGDISLKEIREKRLAKYFK